MATCGDAVGDAGAGDGAADAGVAGAGVGDTGVNSISSNVRPFVDGDADGEATGVSSLLAIGVVGASAGDGAGAALGDGAAAGAAFVGCVVVDVPLVALTNDGRTCAGFGFSVNGAAFVPNFGTALTGVSPPAPPTPGFTEPRAAGRGMAAGLDTSEARVLPMLEELLVMTLPRLLALGPVVISLVIAV